MRGFELIPRYSGGSPAMVKDRDLANRVVSDEKHDHEAALEGFYGAEMSNRAKLLGLDGIVLERLGDYRFLDMITGVEYIDTPYQTIREPERLFVLRKGSKESYFFRRKLLITLRAAKASGDNMMPVIKALTAQYGIDGYSAESMNLWNNRAG